MDRDLKSWAWKLSGVNADTDSDTKEAETTTMISWQELSWQEATAGME